MRTVQIAAEHCLTQAMIVRLVRRWVAARSEGLATASSLVSLAQELSVDPVVAVALDSLLHLTEACLGRPLRAECCCSAEAGPDELAVLQLIRAARAPDPVLATAAMPHGLPGALAWAAASLARLMGEGLAAGDARAPRGCPFGQGNAGDAMRRRRR